MDEPYFQADGVQLYHGDALEVLRSLPDASVDAVCTDPPYGLRFMGQAWDGLDIEAGIATRRAQAEMPEDGRAGRNGGYRSAAAEAGRYDLSANEAFGEWCYLWATECLRVLKPGGHLLSFGGSRTWHRLAVAVEDAGFEIRDSIAWLFGSGFPKSLDVSRAIDKRPGVMRHADFAAHLAERRETAGLSRADVSERVVGTRTGACWNWEHHQFPEAKWWPALRDLLDLDEATWGPVIADAERQKVGTAFRVRRESDVQIAGLSDGEFDLTAPATDAAHQWRGWGTALKPAHEPVVCARKPYAEADILARIGSQLDALEDACRQRVSGAARNSAPTRHASPEATTGSAPDSAATPPGGELASATATGVAARSSAATATSVSVWTAETFLSTVMSWKACWAELSEAMSMSTTSTTTSRTTDLRTLSSCLSQITQRVMARSTLEPPSWSSLATVVDNLFAAGVLSSRSTLALSAIESATSETLPTSLDAGGSSPGFEPIVVGRKPLAGTVAANVLEHGTGALHIDACRIEHGGEVDLGAVQRQQNRHDGDEHWRMRPGHEQAMYAPGGRWPTNVVLDDTTAAELDEQTGELTSGSRAEGVRSGMGYHGANGDGGPAIEGNSGGASRFFPVFRYEAKASAAERPRVNGVAHATVKPLSLVRWLIRLVTPPGGTVLEPFAGSGTTVEAALIEGFHCIAIEREADYLPLIEARIARRRNPTRALELAGEDMGLLGLLHDEDGDAA